MTEEEDIVPEEGMTASDLAELGKKWMDRIREAERREKDWMDDAEKAENAYLVKDTELSEPLEFNILHSNVETIVPNIVSSTPIPDIRPRASGVDEVGRVVSQILEGCLDALIDDEALLTQAEAVAQDVFVAGRGVLRVKFHADIDENDDVRNEWITYEVVSWKDYREGAAQRWDDVPWVAFRHIIPKETIERLSDPELDALQLDPVEALDGSDSEDGDAAIWEIWDKEKKRVLFIADASQKVLNVQDDPLGLEGFFPMPEPVVPISSTGDRIPVCPYTIYEGLARELDTQTRRINKIMDGLRVRGAFIGDGQIAEMIAEADDNVLVAIENLQNLGAAGGLDNMIAWWPIEQAVNVLRELYVQREQTKQTIYEVTGISDIVRGASKANETATAQRIKQDWGSARIKKMQRMIERMVRDVFSISCEILTSKFTPETIMKISGVVIEDEQMAGPVFEMFAGAMDFYRIDVESDSTIRGDMTRNREEMAEFLQGTSTYFSAMAPVAQGAPQAIEPLVDIYASFARRFNLGKQAEDALEKLVEVAKGAAQEAQQNNPAQQAAQAEQAKLQAEQQAEQARMQMEMQKMQAEMQFRMQEMQAEVAIKQQELQIKQAELEMKRMELGLKEAEMGQRMALETRKIENEEFHAGGGPVQVTQGIEALAQQNAQNLAQVQASMDQMAQAVQQLAAYVAAPRQLVRDEAGRPVGSQVVMQ